MMAGHTGYRLLMPLLFPRVTGLSNKAGGDESLASRNVAYPQVCKL